MKKFKQIIRQNFSRLIGFASLLPLIFANGCLPGAEDTMKRFSKLSKPEQMPYLTRRLRRANFSNP